MNAGGTRSLQHLLVAHGSPDPRHSAALRSLTLSLRERGLACDIAFLEHDTPMVNQWLSSQQGTVAVTALLLAPGYHARVDVPRLLTAAHGVSRSGLSVDDRGPLGVGAWLNATLDDLVTAAGGTTETPVVVAAAGSTDVLARAYLAEYASFWGRTRPGSVSFAVTTGAGDAVADAVGSTGRAPRQGVVLPLMIAPGVLADRVAGIAAVAGLPVTGTLTDSPLFTDAVVERLQRGPASATSRESAR